MGNTHMGHKVMRHLLKVMGNSLLQDMDSQHLVMERSQLQDTDSMQATAMHSKAMVLHRLVTVPHLSRATAPHHPGMVLHHHSRAMVRHRSRATAEARPQVSMLWGAVMQLLAALSEAIIITARKTMAGQYTNAKLKSMGLMS